MKRYIIFSTIAIIILTSCSISYKFSGSSINYDLTKSISIALFPNQARLVSPDLERMFNEKMKDTFTRNTRLDIVEINADMELEGEIVGYDLSPLAVAEDGFASRTKLTMIVKMRFRNNKEEGQDKEETFTAFRDFPADKMLDDVQDTLNDQLTKEIIDQIFNATMANW